jgi:hypothetical protein
MIPVTLSGQVWDDYNLNGAIDPGEPGIAGVTITIQVAQQFPPPGTPFSPVGTVTTDASGNWSFTYDFTDNSGVYLIQALCGVAPPPPDPSGWQFTTANESSEYTIDTAHPGTTNFPGILFGQGQKKACFFPASVWVHEVCWLPGMGVAFTFKDRGGTPYFRCYYPDTTYALYEFFLTNAGPGHWVWATGLYWAPYIPLPLGDT